MLAKSRFILAHQIGDRSFYSSYKYLKQNQWKPYSELKTEQESKLRNMINFAYKNVPYYHHLFQSLNLIPNDIKKAEDLEKIPILTKEIINDNWEQLKPINLSKIKHYTRSTGGSTGTPFQYRISKNDRFFSGAILYRGWSYGDYELGDKMIFLAGSSLDIGSKSMIVKKAHEISRNLKKLSSFDMGLNDMQQYAQIINSFNPKSMRGYASSLNFFASYIDENDVCIISPHAIYTTAEKLLPHMRKNIENVFDCDVYDNYGLNDGGVGAYECSEHNGLHIDTERSLMEIVDDKGHQISEGVGNILATSLHNYAMPFIRYDTGDMGHITEDKCGCGRNSKLLKEVIGRSVDILQTPEGKAVHGWFLLYIFWEYGTGIKEYQVIQKKLNQLIIKIVPNEDFKEEQLIAIRDIIKNKSDKWNIEFKIVDNISRTKSGKYKFILNLLNEVKK